MGTCSQWDKLDCCDIWWDEENRTQLRRVVDWLSSKALTNRLCTTYKYLLSEHNSSDIRYGLCDICLKTTSYSVVKQCTNCDKRVCEKCEENGFHDVLCRKGMLSNGLRRNLMKGCP